MSFNDSYRHLNDAYFKHTDEAEDPFDPLSSEPEDQVKAEGLWKDLADCFPFQGHLEGEEATEWKYEWVTIQDKETGLALDCIRNAWGMCLIPQSEKKLKDYYHHDRSAIQHKLRELAGVFQEFNGVQIHYIHTLDGSPSRISVLFPDGYSLSSRTYYKNTLLFESVADYFKSRDVNSRGDWAGFLKEMDYRSPK